MSKEAYMAYAKVRNFQPGDLVNVRFAVPDYACGWNNHWPGDMNKYVGNHAIVSKKDDGSGVALNTKGEISYRFPVFCLSLIKRAEPSEKEKQRNWIRATKRAEAKLKFKKSNLMTIEFEKDGNEYKILAMKNVKSSKDLPSEYGHQAGPAFVFSCPSSDARILSISSITSFEISPGTYILAVGYKYTEKQFGLAIAFLKAAGKRLTEINRKAREDKKTLKQGTITI